MDINSDPSYSRAMDPHMVPSSSLGWMSPCSWVAVQKFLIIMTPMGDTFLGHQLDHRKWFRLWTFTGPSLVTVTMDISTDLHSCIRVIDQIMALVSIPGPDIAMAQIGTPTWVTTST